MYDTIIIGAGPAGLMAGITATDKTLIIEKNSTAGKKLLITGGGRCNVTNKKNNRDFLDNIDVNKKHLYSTINNFGPYDIIDFFESNGVKLKEEKDNKIFPISNKSFSILELLLKKYKGDIHYQEEVVKVEKEDSFFIVKTKNTSYKSKKLLITTGGSSFQKTGSTGDNLKFAKMFKQPVVSIYPAEVGISLKRNLELAGTSIENVNVKINKKCKTGNLIFTHNGLSGEAIMKASEFIYKENIKQISIDFLPDVDILKELELYNRDKELHTYLEKYFTKKLSLFFLNDMSFDKKIKIKQLNNKDKEKLSAIHNYIFDIKSVGNIEIAYVTGGGIDMKYINSKTMESTIIPGLYFAGEALDIHGPIGGYNITLALSTGYTAGLNFNKGEN